MEAVRAVVVGTKAFAYRLKRSRANTGSSGTNVEVNVGEQQSPVERAMYEYRQELEHEFGSSIRIGDIMDVVRNWTNGS